MQSADSGYPVRFEVDYPEAPSRGLALLGVLFFIKGLLLIPHIIVLYFLGIAGFIVFYIGYWAVLITGSYPQGLFAFVLGIQRWSARTDSWMYGTADKIPAVQPGRCGLSRSVRGGLSGGPIQRAGAPRSAFPGQGNSATSTSYNSRRTGLCCIRSRLCRLLGGANNRQVPQRTVYLGGWCPEMVL